MDDKEKDRGESNTSMTPEEYWRIYKEQIKRFRIHIFQNINEFNIEISRNVTIGSALFAATAILLLVETGINSTALKVSLIGFAVCIPLSISWASYLQAILSTGSVGFSHFRQIHESKWLNILHQFWLNVARISLCTGFGALIWHLLPLAFYVLIGIAAIAWMLQSLFKQDIFLHYRKTEKSDH